MTVDKDMVARIAKLSRISVQKDKLVDFSLDLSNIIEWVDNLNEVNTSNIKPMTSIVETELSLREDKINDGNYQDKILSNAPESNEGFFVVPKVVE